VLLVVVAFGNIGSRLVVLATIIAVAWQEKQSISRIYSNTVIVTEE
jgi:hypothetical protein